MEAPAAVEDAGKGCRTSYRNLPGRKFYFVLEAGLADTDETQRPQHYHLGFSRSTSRFALTTKFKSMEDTSRAGASSSLNAAQRPVLGKKSGGRGLKSSGQRSSSSQHDRSIDTGELAALARRSAKKGEEHVVSVLNSQGTRPYASDGYPERSNPANDTGAAPSRTAVKSSSGSTSLQQSKTIEERAEANQARTKSLAGTNPVHRTRFLDAEDITRRSRLPSAGNKATFSRSATPPSEPVRRANGKRTLTKSSGMAPPANAVAGPSGHRRDNPVDGRDEPVRIDLSQVMRTSAIVKTYAEIRRRSMMRPSEGITIAAKAGPSIPHWQRDDEERAKALENRRPDQAEREFVKRIGTLSLARRTTGGPRPLPFRGAPSHSKSYVGRHLTLRQQGEPDEGSDSDSDSPMEVDGPLPQRKTVRLQQTGLKAARKREWPQAPLFDPDSDSDELVHTASSDEVIALDSGSSTTEGEDQSGDSSIEEIEPPTKRTFSPSEIEILPGPPSKLSASENMTKAIEVLSLSLARMHQTKRFPFLQRNLRRGFTKRCQQLNVPTEPVGEGARLRLTYEYKSEIIRERLRDWACPLCELHGFFTTREMLACHLSWDHKSARAEWSQHQSGAWNLRLTITDLPLVHEKDNDTLPKPVEQPLRADTPPQVTEQQQGDISSPFPFVTLSPPEPAPTSASARSHVQEPTSPLANVKIQPRDPSTPFTLSSRSSRSLTTNLTPTPSSSRGRSTTVATTATTTTAATASTQRLRDTRYPTPPPPDNPLGPAARPPYLPAMSEYGGPDIYYSCRPSGACLYDLLNTLPLEPFGVLAWDVLDREDEIYDSDNVKDEYKVMHALWGRDYYKGTKAFVDFYWKMIHRAAGWDALRYWLLMLVVNRFITGAEVASLLKHYESLTGMDAWYE
ncbi:hypothetical protein DXG01_001830 [Tephrocybe rancida]|nr:hypothetical protein DXG01_001830 [Tephrocybe rancida]